MNLINFTLHPNSLQLETSQGLIDLTAYTSGIIRIRYTLDPAFSPKKSLMVLPEAQNPTEISVRETPEALFFSTSKLTVQIDRRTLAFIYRDAKGQILTREPARGGKTLMPVDVIKSIPLQESDTQTELGADGLRTSAGTFKEVVDRKAYHTKLEFEWTDGEALYGLGSHEEGMLNLRGQHQYIYQQNMKVAIPVLVSTRGYGILLDSYSLMIFHDDAFGSYLWTDVDDEMDFYFVYGPEFDSIVAGIRRLTGKVPMLPKWMFGYLQSKEAYLSQAELIDVVKEYRTRRLPLDGIVQDWRSWTGDLWGQKTLDPIRFPDPDGMMAEIHKLHARLMISVWPNTDPKADDNKEMKKQGCLLGNRTTYDAFQPQGREIYWRQANTGLFSHGIDAWWCDCTEPFEADWQGVFKPEPEERLRINTGEAKRYLDPEYINAYSLLHSQGIYEGQRGTTDLKRVVNLTRSAYPGQQRYGTITWSGDISASWDTLRRQIADGLNFCVTGSPYWTLDIGGFFVRNKPELWFWNGDYENGCEDLGYRELYLRWFQYGIFLPIFRAHGTDTPREIWRFGAPGEPIYDSMVKFLKLRYRLLPYIYSLAGQVTQADYTIYRMLPFDFRDDPNTYDIHDQFMFGPSFLVCPVTHPMYYGPNSTPLPSSEETRAVYLPAGSDWFDFWTDQCYSGGQTVLANASIYTMPLFVRSGSILPLGPEIQYAGEAVDAALVLKIYTGCNGHFTLYEDEADNYNYEKGSFAAIEINWEDESGCLILGERQGSYPGMKKSLKLDIIFVGKHQTFGGAISVVYAGEKLVVDF
ncbi:MAG: TIM-barrel domain-containing protein [Anaerolineales bacterium]|jgi:alpha-D-xyloside xylohydrolase